MTSTLKPPTLATFQKRRVPTASQRIVSLRPGVAYLGEGAVISPAALAGASLASLSARHILRDGEAILLILKPSRWYIAFSSLLFAAGVVIILCAMQLSGMPQTHLRYFIEGGIFSIACRVMWATLNWMGRLYVLTDQRVLRFAGVFNIDVFDCPLRKVANTRLIHPLPERLLRLGTIEIQPADAGRPATAWQMVNRPSEVHDQLVAAIRKARQGGCCDR